MIGYRTQSVGQNTPMQPWRTTTPGKNDNGCVLLRSIENVLLIILSIVYSAFVFQFCFYNSRRQYGGSIAISRLSIRLHRWPSHSGSRHLWHPRGRIGHSTVHRKENQQIIQRMGRLPDHSRSSSKSCTMFSSNQSVNPAPFHAYHEALLMNFAAMVRIAGVGYHVAEVVTTNPEELVLWAKCLVAMEWVYGLAVMLPKLAILGFYLRIFVQKSFRRTVYVLIGIVISTFLATGLTAMFQCIPLQYVWDKAIPGGRCINVLAFYRWISLPNIITDALMLALPIPMVWKLNTSTGKKFGLTIGFLTGSM